MLKIKRKAKVKPLKHQHVQNRKGQATPKISTHKLANVIRVDHVKRTTPLHCTCQTQNSLLRRHCKFIQQTHVKRTTPLHCTCQTQNSFYVGIADLFNRQIGGPSLGHFAVLFHQKSDMNTHQTWESTFSRD